MVRATTVRKQALRQAQDLLGGPGGLLEAFTVNPAELDRWLQGKAEVPAWVFLRALDIVHARDDGQAPKRN